MMQRVMRRAGSPLMLLAALGLVVALAAPSWAAWGGRGKQRLMNLTPEQAGQLFELRQKFMNETAAQRKEMTVKRAELRQLWKADTPDEKAILAKAKELHALRGQLLEKMVAFRLEARKIAPQACPFMGPGGGRGMGPGGGKGMGPGAGMGPGGGAAAEMGCPGGSGLNLALGPELDPGIDW